MEKTVETAISELLAEEHNLTDNVKKEIATRIGRITSPSAPLISIDEDDAMSALQGKTLAFAGIGSGTGVDKGLQAALEALSKFPGKLCGSQASILAVLEGDFSLKDVNDCVETLKEKVGDSANIIFGAIANEEMKERMEASFVVTI